MILTRVFFTPKETSTFFPVSCSIRCSPRVNIYIYIYVGAGWGESVLNLLLPRVAIVSVMSCCFNSITRVSFSSACTGFPGRTCTIQEEGVGSVEFVGPGGETLPDESTISGVAWHGGFDIKLDGKQVSRDGLD